MKKLSKEQVLEVCRLYEDGIGSETISKQFGVSPVAIRGLLKRRGVEIRSMSQAKRRYSLNERVFDSVDTEEAAYWLGFIAADGCITREGFSVTLSIKDAAHLGKLAEFLGTNKPIRMVDDPVSPYANLDICSPVIKANLITQGITPKKTFTVAFPRDIPSDLHRHFIRGYVDGDGGFHRPPKRLGNDMFAVTSNHEMLAVIQEILMRECQLNQTKLSQRHKESPIFTLNYCGSRQVRRIHTYLYEGCNVALDRKKDIF